MKKVFTALLLVLLLTACGSADDTASTTTSETPEATALDLATMSTLPDVGGLTEAEFINISAEMLCYKVDHPDVSDAQLEEQAIQILASYQISEADYTDFQINAENDPESKDRIAYAIIGQMSQICDLALAE